MSFPSRLSAASGHVLLWIGRLTALLASVCSNGPGRGWMIVTASGVLDR